MSQFQFDHRDIKEEALEERYYTDPSGEERLAKILNRSKLIKLQKERAQEGKKVMEPFRLWCIRAKSLTATNAAVKGATVYNAIWETHNRPWELLLRPDLHKFRRDELYRSLSLFGQWLATEGATEEDKEWGRRMLSNIARVWTKKVRKPPTRRAKRDLLKPLTHKEWKAIFEGIERWHKIRGASRPWARNFFRIRYKLGLSYRNMALYYLERRDIDRALEDIKDGKKNVVIKMWTSDSVTRLMPVRLVKKDLQELCDWPVAWGVIADLINPLGETVDDRVKGCHRRVYGAWKDIIKHSDGLIPPATSTWQKQAKLAAIRHAWEKTHDKLLLQSMFGLTQQWLHDMDFLVE